MLTPAVFHTSKCCGLPLPRFGEKDCRAGGENIIKMFPVRVINAGAPATLRFLQQHCLTVAGFVSTVAFDLDAAKVVCADAVLRHRADLTNYIHESLLLCLRVP